MNLQVWSARNQANERRAGDLHFLGALHVWGVSGRLGFIVKAGPEPESLVPASSGYLL